MARSGGDGSGVGAAVVATGSWRWGRAVEVGVYCTGARDGLHHARPSIKDARVLNCRRWIWQ